MYRLAITNFDRHLPGACRLPEEIREQWYLARGFLFANVLANSLAGQSNLPDAWAVMLGAGEVPDRAESLLRKGYATVRAAGVKVFPIVCVDDRVLPDEADWILSAIDVCPRWLLSFRMDSDDCFGTKYCEAVEGAMIQHGRRDVFTEVRPECSFEVVSGCYVSGGSPTSACLSCGGARVAIEEPSGAVQRTLGPWVKVLHKSWRFTPPRDKMTTVYESAPPEGVEWLAGVLAGGKRS